MPISLATKSTNSLLCTIVAIQTDRETQQRHKASKLMFRTLKCIYFIKNTLNIFIVYKNLANIFKLYCYKIGFKILLIRGSRS